MEWSTVVDAPTTPLMPVVCYGARYKSIYGKHEWEKFDIEYLREHGSYWCPHYYRDIKELIKGNRAGDGERSVQYYDLIKAYIT